MGNSLKKIVGNKYLCLVIFFVIIFLIHQFYDFMNDDIFFGNILNNYSFSGYLNERYNIWTSRIIIEGVLITVSRNILLWRVLDSLIIILFIYSIEKIFFNTGLVKNYYVIFLLFMLYPFYQMAEAGFAATTVNYLWPFTFLLFSFIPLRYIYDNKKVKIYLWPLFIIGFLYACNQEQAVCIGLVISILSLILFKLKNKNIIYSLVLLVLSLISLIFILLCPGNDLRMIAEIGNCYPDYVNSLFLDKIYLGIVSTCSILINNFIVLFIFSFFLLRSVFYEEKNLLARILAIIQFFVVGFLSLYRVYVCLVSKNFYVAYTYGIFYYNTSIGHVFTLNFKNIFIFSFCILMVLIFCYILYFIFKKDSWYSILMLFLGCGTRLLMGFSPTIFASGFRTNIFLCFSLLFIILLLWNKYKDRLSYMKIVFINVIIIVFIIVNYYLVFKAIPFIKNV